MGYPKLGVLTAMTIVHQPIEMLVYFDPRPHQKKKYRPTSEKIGNAHAGEHDFFKN